MSVHSEEIEDNYAQVTAKKQLDLDAQDTDTSQQEDKNPTLAESSEQEIQQHYDKELPEADTLISINSVSEEENKSNQDKQPEINSSPSGTVMTRKEDDILITSETSNAYICPNKTSNTRSVLELRKFYTNLEQGTRVPESNENTMKNSRRSVRYQRRNTYDKTDRPHSHFETADPNNHDQNGQVYTSVEELRQIFENYNENNKKAEVQVHHKTGSSHFNHRSKSVDPVRSNRTTSIEFYSRPPKFRTPSPKLQNLPTPPPLPLPPSLELLSAHEINTNCNSHYKQVENNNVNDNNVKKNSQQFSFHWKQPAKPILSMNLPFRSRSLALEKIGESNQNDRKAARYRACSITQRSLSPISKVVRKKGTNRHDRVAYKLSGTNQPNPNGQMRKQTNPRFESILKNSNVSQENSIFKSALVRYNEPVIKPDQIVYVNPVSADGVYVRSAVVYERVNENLRKTEPKNFITTFVVSDDKNAGKATIHATNLWIAEQLIKQPNKTSTNTPYRSQPITKTDGKMSTDHNEPKGSQTPFESSPVRVNFHSDFRPSRSPTTYSQRWLTRNQSDEKSKHSSASPQPLPTPPPIEVHPHILRCAVQDSVTEHMANNKSSSVDKATQFQQIIPHIETHAHSWSVKSLSPPPPFRTPWLSSLSGSRSRTNVRESDHSPNYKRREITKAEHHQRQSRPLTRTRNYYKHKCCVECFRLEQARRNKVKEKKEWINRAKAISQSRHNYHELRGSWSPPHLQSPPRQTPNNMEEYTEREIQRYVRQQVPPASGPRVIIPNSSSHYTPEYVQALDKGIQCDNPTNEHLNHVEIKCQPNCIDTTPISDDFDAKRAYFEELIRTNKNLARCSFCSDCYHCSPGPSSPKISAYSSWDSELHNMLPQTNTSHKRIYSDYEQYPDRKMWSNKQISTQVRNIANNNANNDSYYYPDYKYCTNYGIRTIEPQQYASSTYLALNNPIYSDKEFTTANTDQILINNSMRNYKVLNQNVCNYDQFTKHDYYAKSINEMPKVAPNPPNTWNDYKGYYNSIKSTTITTTATSATVVTSSSSSTTINYNRLNMGPLRVELEHSPNNYFYTNPTHIHSPPCRFSYTNKKKLDLLRDRNDQQGSMESLHCEQIDDNLNTLLPNCYHGRVKQIVQALDKQTAVINARLDSMESINNSTEHGHIMRRSHSDRFSYIMPRTSWQN